MREAEFVRERVRGMVERERECVSLERWSLHLMERKTKAITWIWHIFTWSTSTRSQKLSTEHRSQNRKEKEKRRVIDGARIHRNMPIIPHHGLIWVHSD